MKAALVMTTTFMLVEVVAGLLSGSLALIADAGHMLTDSAAIGLALFASWIASRPASAERTYGWERTEVLAAAANALSLWLISAWIGWEAYHRFADGFRGDPVEIEGGWVLLVGGIGLLINVVAAWMLHGSSGHSLNVEGALQHVIADIMGSVAVIISAVFILLFEWWWIDPALSVLIALLILASSWNLMVSIFDVLIEATPEDIDVYALSSDIEDVPGVTLLHDVHVWTVTSGYVSMTAHILVDREHEGEQDHLLAELTSIIKDRYGISHVTLQLENSAGHCTSENHHLDHLVARKYVRKRRKLPTFGHSH
ncbi:MAG: cation diffusion facilitator family transporter [Acidimicrobiaceae bacterium]|nr:cation diffusion facilitator family transporter [Acidimicrobiaceae bacterium]